MKDQMTIKVFRQLLTNYLTEPEYACVKHIGENRMSVKLPSGERFYIAITIPAK